MLTHTPPKTGNYFKPAEFLDMPHSGSKGNEQAVIIKMKSVLDKMALGCIIYNPSFRIIYINPLATQIFGYKEDEVYDKDFFNYFSHEYLRAYNEDVLKQLQNGKTAINEIEEHENINGEKILCKWNKSALIDEDDNFLGVICIFEDITLSMQNERLQDGQKKILEMIASGATLTEILTSIILFIERESGRIQGSVLLLDREGKTLHTGAGPNLPAGYNREVDGLEVGPYNGSCGTAVYNKEIIIVKDISTDPHWAKYKDIAAYYNLKAATSIPIFGSDKEILGTFAFYYKTSASPNAYEMQLIEVASYLAGIAIKKDKTEKALAEGQELQKLITENINDIIIIYDLDGNLQYISPSMEIVLGYRPQELIGKNRSILIHPDAVLHWKETFKKTVKGETTTDIHQSKHIDGSWKWMEWWGKLIHSKDANYILAVGRDITNKKMSEDALIESERQLKEAQRLTKLGSFEYDLLSGKAIWSEQQYKIFGHKPNAIVPSYENFVKQIFPNDLLAFENAIKVAMEKSGKMDMEFRILRPDGIIIPIHLKAEVLFNKEGKAVKILGTSQDITERRAAEEALRVSEEKFRTAFEFAGEGISLISINECFMKVNKAMCSLLGYSEEELRTKSLTSIVHPDYVEETHIKLQKMLEGEIDSWKKEQKYIDKKGFAIWGNLSISILRDRQNIPICFISILENITERKIAEENQKLLTQDLIRQNEGLYQFSYVTSHNLRAPIANILGLLNLLDLNPNDSDHELIIENLRKSAINMDNIITDLNSIITYQKEIAEHKQEIVFSDLITVIKKNLDKQIQNSGAEIITDFSKAPTIYSILSYINSILSNLIENAIKFRSPKRPLVLRINTTKEKDYTILSVSDNGLGIDLKTQGNKIFGLYKKFHTHTEGKGLGLHLVKTQVEALNGKIVVESEVDKGTNFKIYLEQK